MKKYLYAGLLACTIASCTDDFLKEEMVSTITQDYFNTEQGLDQLIVGTYNAERVKWGYSEGVYMFETGLISGHLQEILVNRLTNLWVSSLNLVLDFL